MHQRRCIQIAFFNVMPCRLADEYRRFSGTGFLLRKCSGQVVPNRLCVPVKLHNVTLKNAL